MFNINKNFFIFLIIILVVSITPVSALNYKEISENGQYVPRVLQDKVVSDNGQIKYLLHSLEGDLHYILSEIDKLNLDLKNDDKILKLIIKKLETVVVTLGLILVNSKKANTDMESVHTFIVRDVVDSDFNFDTPEYMAEQLTIDLNTDVQIENNVPVSELNDGDIVLYYSGEFRRYLSVVKIANKTNSTKKSIYYLKGTGNKLVPLNSTNVTKLDYGNKSKDDAINASMTIQQKIINSIQYDADLYKKDSIYYHTEWGEYLGVGLIFALVATTFTIATGLCDQYELMFAADALLIPLDAEFTINAFHAENIYNKEDNLADVFGDYAKNSQNDLNNYTKKLPEKFMNVTTFEGVPIVTHPNITNWKSKIFILDEDAKNGDVLDGPGLQFLYGPYEGFVGIDTFKFQYLDDDGNPTIMNVLINVQPIPVIPIPQEA